MPEPDGPMMEHLLAGSNLEVDAFQNLERAEPLVQIDDPHKGLGVAHANSDEKSFSLCPPGPIGLSLASRSTPSLGLGSGGTR